MSRRMSPEDISKVPGLIGIETGKTTIDRQLPTPQESLFHKIYQGKETNALSRIATTPTQKDLFGNATFSGKDISLFIPEYTKLVGGLKQSAFILLDSFIIQITESGHQDPFVVFTLKEYMEIRGQSDATDARNQLKRDIDALSRFKITYTDNRKSSKSKGDFMTIPMLGGKYGYSQGKVYFTFSPEYFALIKACGVMDYPSELRRFNATHNPYSFHFLRRISEHKRMNYGTTNENIISVKTLIEAAPNFPKYEDYAKKGRIQEKIIEPFIRDMDKIASFTWHFCASKGELAEEPDTWAEFSQALIKIEWIDYPAQSPRLEARKKKAALAKPRQKKHADGGAEQAGLF